MRLTSNDDGPVEWLLGLYYLDENAFQNTLINRDPKPFGAAKTINVLHDVNADSSAFFGQFSMQPNETLKLTAGFRSTDDEKDAVGGTKVQIRPPAPGCNSTLCIFIPTGISCKGKQFPILISTFGPFSI